MRKHSAQQAAPTIITFAGTPQKVLERVKGWLVYKNKSRKAGKVRKKLLRMEVVEVLELEETELFLLLEVADFLQLEELVRMVTSVIVARAPLTELERVVSCDFICH